MRMEGRSLKPKWQPGPYAPARGPGGHPAPAFARWIATFGWRLSQTEKQYCRYPFASQIAANPSVAAKKGTSLAVETAPVMRLRYGLRRSEEHTSELQSLRHLVCRLLLETNRDLVSRLMRGTARWRAQITPGR